MIKILFIADTHLGFDYAFKPRVPRRRRGPDFFRNFERALEPAHGGDVDLVVHGGDIFYRSKVPAKLVDMAFQPLKRVADTGVPVYVVPGNHERSNIPYSILAAHPNIFIFEKPMCFVREISGVRLALAGFPFVRHGIRQRFPEILKQTRWHDVEFDESILCMHQSVDGATMGPKNFTFRGGVDVINIRDIPSQFAAVLTGHMHRPQVLQTDLKGKGISTPVLYAGAIERTSFAEKDEQKGYMTVDVEDGTVRKELHWQFHVLPTRPMVSLEVDASNMSGSSFLSWLREEVGKIPADSIVKIKIHGRLNSEIMEMIRAESLRSLAPETMNVDVILVDYRNFHRT
jgi:DNA repair exonuclease SbcCD nuclease subunit